LEHAPCTARRHSAARLDPPADRPSHRRACPDHPRPAAHRPRPSSFSMSSRTLTTAILVAATHAAAAAQFVAPALPAPATILDRFHLHAGTVQNLALPLRSAVP